MLILQTILVLQVHMFEFRVLATINQSCQGSQTYELNALTKRSFRLQRYMCEI